MEQKKDAEMVLYSSEKTILRKNVQEWMVRDLPEQGTELGVSLDYVVNMVREFQLTSTDLGWIVEAKMEHNAGISTIKKFLHDGLKPEEINTLYFFRSSLEYQHGSIVSLKRIVELCQITTLPFTESTIDLLLEVSRNYFDGDPSSQHGSSSLAFKKAIECVENSMELAYNEILTQNEEPMFDFWGLRNGELEESEEAWRVHSKRLD